MGVPNRGPQITAVTLLFLSLSWVVVLARYYVRAFITKNFFIDDFLTGVCLVRSFLFIHVKLSHGLTFEGVVFSLLGCWYHGSALGRRQTYNPSTTPRCQSFDEGQFAVVRMYIQILKSIV